MIAVILAIYAVAGIFAALIEFRLKKLRWRILTPESCRQYLLGRGWSEPFRNELFPKLAKDDLKIAVACVTSAPVSREAVLSAVDAALDSRHHLVVFTWGAPHESIVAEMLSRQISVIHYAEMKNLEQILRAHAKIIAQHRTETGILLTRSLQPPVPATLLGPTAPQKIRGGEEAVDVLLAETQLVQCFFRDRGSDKIIIAFSDPWHKGREGRLLPRIDPLALGYSVIDFVATEPNWFPADDMAALLPVVCGLLDGFSRRITFGFSQGGYGALKFSAALGADISIAFSPQFSIDPRVVKGDRFGHLFRSQHNVGMGLARGDCICPSYVFSDPFDRTDRQHVDLIARAIDIRQLAMPFFGHSTAGLFAAPDRLVPLLAACAEDDVATLRRICRQARHINRDRAYLLALHLTERSPRRALKIAGAHKAAWSQNKQAEMCFHLAMGQRDRCGLALVGAPGRGKSGKPRCARLRRHGCDAGIPDGAGVTPYRACPGIEPGQHQMDLGPERNPEEPGQAAGCQPALG